MYESSASMAVNSGLDSRCISRESATTDCSVMRRSSSGEEGKPKECLGPVRAQSVPHLSEVGVRWA